MNNHELMKKFLERFEPGKFVKHFKRETINTLKMPLYQVYKILRVGFGTDDLEPYVVYESMYELGRVWIRDLADFMSEVDHEKYPEIKQKYKFEPMEPLFSLIDYVSNYIYNLGYTGNLVNDMKNNTNKHKVITICGSTKFKDDIIRVQRELSLKGNIVFACPFFQHTDGDKFTNETILMLTQMHLEKIDMSDAIYVVNKNGYIGEATQSEIYYALFKHKEVIYMENVNVEEDDLK